MSSSFSSGSCCFLLCFLLLCVLGKKLLVLLHSLTSILVTANNFSLVLVLATETGLSDHTLDLGRLVESLTTLALDLTSDDIFTNIILLLVKSEGLNDFTTSF